MRNIRILLALALGCFAPALFAQPTAAPVDPAHADLRAMRDTAVAAFNKGDFEGITPFLHPNVVFTPLNAEVCHGIEEVRAYTAKMMEGPGAIVSDIKIDLAVDKLAELYGGDAAVAWGSITESFKLTGGLEFAANDRWSATLVKQDGKWLVANFHTSTNLFDNPLLNMAKRSVYLAAGIAGLAGMALGFIFARIITRRRLKAA